MIDIVYTHMPAYGMIGAISKKGANTVRQDEKRIEREINILFRKRKEGIRLEFHSRISF